MSFSSDPRLALSAPESVSVPSLVMKSVLLAPLSGVMDAKRATGTGAMVSALTAKLLVLLTLPAVS